MFRSAISVLLLITWCVIVNSQYVPPSPCPDIFSYKSDGQKMYGLIRYQPPGQSKYIFMRADFVISAELPSGNTGRLEVQGSKEAVLLRMLRGQSLDYRVDFPLASPLPSLATITINHGQVICSGEPESGSPSKSYSVEHLLFDTGDSLSLLELNFGNAAQKQPTLPAPIPKPVQLSTTSNELECGLVSGGNSQVELVFLGQDVYPGEWPWLVAIFAKTRNSIYYICAGSLVSNKHVITAAHCVSRKNKVRALGELVLKLGAYNLNYTDDPQMVTRGIKAAATHFFYDPYTLANDLLVLLLDSPVTFTRSIRPVCLWEGAIDLNLIIGKHGTVVGWGGNELHEAGTGEPRKATLPVVSTETCRGTRKEFHDLTSRTTMCLGNRNGTGPCNGDSGGGLYMLSGGRWRLRGLVSVSLRPATGESKCNLQEYVVFTDVAQYLPWVRPKLAGMPVPSQGPNAPTTSSTIQQPVEMMDFTCGVISGGNERVPLIYDGNSVSSGDWPWIVSIHRQGPNYIIFILRGSLISNQHVITVAFDGIVKNRVVDVRNLIVRVGGFKFFEDDGVEISSTIEDAAVHDSYDPGRSLNNILIMTLSKPVVFSPRVIPVCLWDGDTDQNLIVGSRGMVVGWGRTERAQGVGFNGPPPRAAAVPIVSTEECVLSNKQFTQSTSSTTLCAGYRNGTGPCTDQGGGLYMLSGGRWRLRGLQMALQMTSITDGFHTCNIDEYIVYTDVAQYLPSIRKYMEEDT